MIEFLLSHAAENPISFHMPGHKGSDIFRKYGFDSVLRNLVDMDVTEIPGADNLFQAEGIIKDLQYRYANLYGVDRSYLLINGSSGGLIAAILAAVPTGGKLIMARNCHKSVFNALTLGNIEPVYARPTLNEDYGIAGAIAPEEIERLLKENPDAEAVILPSPNYYGICSDITAIAEVVHKAGKILIVDQAHGAHLKFFHKFGQGGNTPKAAEDCGADIVINSTHKTLASLTQSAVMNLNSDRVDRYVLEDKLQAIESTSPSYILMSFLDINAKILEEHGADAMKDWKDNIDYFYKEAAKIPNLKVMGEGMYDSGSLLEKGGGGVPDHLLGKGGTGISGGDMNAVCLDRTKINLDLSELGIDGRQFENLIMKRGIFPELYTGNLLMLMTGVGNTREHMDRTLRAICDIVYDSALGANRGEIDSAGDGDDLDTVMGQTDVGSGTEFKGTAVAAGDDSIVPEPGALHPVPKSGEFVDIDRAAGRICAASIIPYPPGIPLVCPGEEITEDTAAYIKKLRTAGEKVIGVDDEGRMRVGKIF